jgi:hypothetical protein
VSDLEDIKIYEDHVPALRDVADFGPDAVMFG